MNDRRYYSLGSPLEGLCGIHNVCASKVVHESECMCWRSFTNSFIPSVERRRKKNPVANMTINYSVQSHVPTRASCITLFKSFRTCSWNDFAENSGALRWNLGSWTTTYLEICGWWHFHLQNSPDAQSSTSVHEKYHHFSRSGLVFLLSLGLAGIHTLCWCLQWTWYGRFILSLS